MKTLYLLAFSFIFSTSFSQGNIDTKPSNEPSKTYYQKTIFEICPPGETITLSFDISNYSEKSTALLKDELSTYKEKVDFVKIDDISLIMTIIYNEHLVMEELQELFEKYHLNFLRDDK